MGAPKQKWSQEEEDALRAGVVKHGEGKWRIILKDPEYNSILYLRSNVDLKDKWRNMTVMANGWGSREKARLALKRMQGTPKQYDNSKALTTIQSDEDIADAMPVAVSGEMLQITDSKRSMIKLDGLIMEAVTSLKDPGGSYKTAIATYIEEEYCVPSNFNKLLSSKLKTLTGNRKLIKANRKYRIAPARRHASVVCLEEKPRILRKIDLDEIRIPTKAEIDLELAKMRTMTAQEAAIVAARSVAEAEAAIADAEEAARDAELAEAEAEAAQAFAEAAMKTLKGRNNPNLMVRV